MNAVAREWSPHPKTQDPSLSRTQYPVVLRKKAEGRRFGYQNEKSKMRTTISPIERRADEEDSAWLESSI
jgi:hypothetical protein